MPEMPEVASFRKYFEKTAMDRPISFVRVLNPKILRGASPVDLERELAGSRFKSTRQHGKYLFAGLDTGKWLIMHFGMSGFLETVEDGSREPTYSRIVIGFNGGGALAYVNPRMLGWVGIVGSVEEVIEAKKLGPNALDPGLDLECFRKRLFGRKGPVKSVLMDQATVAGIGNIYSDEILFHARIHPGTRVTELNDSQVKDIFLKMKEVLGTAVKLDADYDRFPQSYLLPGRNRKGACPNCGTRWETMKFGGRTAYFCPRCQKKD